MKNLLLSLPKQNVQMITRMVFILVTLGFFGTSAYAQITGTNPASRCGEGTIILGAAGTGTITWYDVPFYGTALGTGASFTTEALTETKTYYVDALDGSGCSLNTTPSGRRTVVATVSASSIQASIFYASNAFCKSIVGEQAVTRTGTAGGTYTVSPSGLTLNSTTGAITPSSSTIGTYTVTYTITNPSQGCTENPATVQVIITNTPLESSISYTGSPFCTSPGTAVNVSLTNPNGGTFSSSPAGLSMDAAGTITPSGSTAGSYTVTYFVSGAGGCAPQTKTASIAITGLPTAAISYTGTPFCKDVATGQSPVLTGTGAYTGGTYTYKNSSDVQTGLTFSAGDITPSTSTSGTYTVTYTTPASGNCAAVAVNTSITINPLPAAAIAGTVSVCQNGTAPNITFTGSLGTAPYTFIYTVNGGGYLTVSSIGAATTTTVAQSTTEAGSFVYALVSVTDANGCSHSASGSATINVTNTPVADFVYTGTPYCKTGTASPLFIGAGIAGTFSGNDDATHLVNVVFVSTATGEVNLASTPAGVYTITNTISSCGSVSSTSPLTVRALPDAAITGTLTACGITTLTAQTAASSPSYIWYKDNVVIDGQTASTLAATASGAYKVNITDGNGCQNTSSASTVVINPVPSASIDGNLTACATSTLTASTDATLPTYIWYKDNVVIESQTSATLVVTLTGAYKVKVTSGNGCDYTSLASNVTINPAIVAGTVTGGTTVCTGANSTLLTLETYTGVIVRWEYSINGGTDWTVIDNGAATNTASGLTTTTLYRAVVGSGACTPVNSASTTMTVVADPSLTQPGNVTICKGGTTTLTTTASGGTGTNNFQWQYSANGSTGWANVADASPTGFTYTGNATNSLVITGSGSETSGTNYYKCVLTTTVASGASGCNTETSSVAITTVDDPAWTSYSLPTPTALCVGGTVAFSVSITGGLGGTISWIRSATAGGSGSTVTSGDAPAVGTWYYRPHYAPTGSGCNLADGTETTVVVSPLPTITSTGIVAAVTYSASSQTTTMPYTATTNSPTSYSINWDAAANTAGLADQGSTSLAFASGEGSVTGIVVTAITVSGLAGTFTGTMTITTANGCTATQAVSLSVNPVAPTGTSPQTFCTGN